MAGEHPWTQATVKTQGPYRRSQGGIFFPSPSGFGSKPAELNKKIAKGLFELGSSKVCAVSESPRAHGQSLLWGAQAAP